MQMKCDCLEWGKKRHIHGSSTEEKMNRERHDWWVQYAVEKTISPSWCQLGIVVVVAALAAAFFARLRERWCFIINGRRSNGKRFLLYSRQTHARVEWLLLSENERIIDGRHGGMLWSRSQSMKARLRFRTDGEHREKTHINGGFFISTRLENAVREKWEKTKISFLCSTQIRAASTPWQMRKRGYQHD
jgi:hypothetical protein